MSLPNLDTSHLDNIEETNNSDKRSNEKIIDEFNSIELSMCREDIAKNEEEINDFKSNNQICKNEMNLKLYSTYESISNDDSFLGVHLDHGDINLSSFLSSIRFIDYLCNICEYLRSMPR